jgi:hypothetical protein
MTDKTLWSDGKSDDLISRISKKDPSSAIYNLLEDIKCLKEDLQLEKNKSNKAEQEVLELKSQTCFYVTTYMNNINGVFIREEDADAHSDKFGGVYSVNLIGMESAASKILGI